MKLIKYSTIFVVTAVLCCAASAQETEFNRKDVPPVVLAAFDKTYSTAKVLEWEKEIHGGQIYYEAETVEGKVSRNVLYAPDGILAQVIEKVTLKDLPPSVTEGVKRQYSTATIRAAYKVTHADTVEYGLSLRGAAPTDAKTSLERNPLARLVAKRALFR